MIAFAAMLRRDIALALRQPGDLLTLLLFFVLVGAVTPFAVGPDRTELARLAPGIVWIAALLASLLGLDRLFRADHEDGSLRGFRHAAIGLEAIVFAKLLAHWLTASLPLIVTVPVLALLLDMDAATLGRTELALLLGTPGLLALGAIGAALTVSLRRGGLIAPVLVLPLAVPLLIFGVGAISPGAVPGSDRAALLFLSGLSLAFSALAPFAAALALRLGAD